MGKKEEPGKGGITNNFYGPVNNIVNNYGTIQSNAPVLQGQAAETRSDIDMKTVVKALERCKAFLWGQAALATVFCVCRDVYNLGDNASQFERQMCEMEVACPPGTIANAMRNNPYMKMSVEKWETHGAQGRVLALIKEFKRSVEEIQAEEVAT